MNDAPQGWHGIFEPGEEISWQGRPDSQVIWHDLINAQTVIGIFFMLFSSAWLFAVRTISSGLPTDGLAPIAILFSFVGSIFFLVGLYLIVGRLFWDAYVRSQTWYTLTNKAAYIASSTFGRRILKRYPAEKFDLPEFVDTQPGTVWFTHVMREVGSQAKGRTSRKRMKRLPIGFRRIEEARKIYGLIRDMT